MLTANRRGRNNVKKITIQMHRTQEKEFSRTAAEDDEDEDDEDAAAVTSINRKKVKGHSEPPTPSSVSGRHQGKQQTSNSRGRVHD